MTVFSAPLHRLTLSSELRQGDVTIAMRPALPMQGIHVTLGNDLAGARVWPGTPTQMLSSQAALGEISSSQTDIPESSITSPGVLPTCAVTRAMHAAGECNPDNQEDKRISVFPVPVFPLPITRSELVKEQQNDPTLRTLYNYILPDDEVEGDPCGYFLQNELLLRKWVPKGDGFGEEIVQIVLPFSQRSTVLQTAHDGVAGHFGVRKTYDKILRHFY